MAVMSKPHRCPHIATTGNIYVYCPGGPDSDFEYSTQSYTGYEPTSMRAIWAGMAFSSSLTHFIEHLIQQQQQQSLFPLSGVGYMNPRTPLRSVLCHVLR
ncbi:hypothetical protein FF1_038747 [Malus domestica]